MKKSVQFILAAALGLSLWQLSSAHSIFMEDKQEQISSFRQLDQVDPSLGQWSQSSQNHSSNPVNVEGTLIDNEACEQVTPAGPDIENGYSNFGLIQIANDLVVPANKNFTLENLSFNTMVEEGKPINSVDLYFYNDSGAGPGSLISSQLGLTPDSIENLGVFNGYDRLTVGLNLDNPVLFYGNSFQTIYWVGIQIHYPGEVSFMEMTVFNMNTPNQVYLYSPVENQFVPGFGDPSDGVLTLSGTCSDIPMCSGTPEAGTIASVTDICPGIDFSMSVSGATQGQSNLTYQWQSKLSSSNDWQNIPGANTFVLNTNISEDTDFRFTIQCGSDTPVASEVVTVTINPPGECHCIPVFSTGCLQFGDYIKDFILNGDNGTQIQTLDTTCPPNSYDDRTDESVGLTAGFQYISQISSGASDDDVAVWIDFNNDGDFAQDELVGTVEDVAGSLKNLTLSIPGNAQLGEHRMRLMMQYFAMPTNSCIPDGPWGMTRDYTVNILAAGDCAGTPTAGTAAGPVSVCSETSFEVTVNGASQASGITFHWESSPSGQNNWTSIPDSETLNLTIADGITEATDYRFSIKCELSGQTSLSNVITVGLKPINECFCTPIYYGGCEYDDAISGVIFKDAANTLMFENYSGCDSDNGYFDYTNSTDPIELVKGETYTITLQTIAPDPGSEELKAWIDFNGSGAFEPEEEIFYTAGMGFDEDGTLSFQLDVDSNLTPGVYRLRFRMIYGATEIDPCTIDGYGEAEDYNVEIKSSMSTSDPSFHGFTYYPNPVKDVLSMKSSQKIESIEIYDLSGRKISGLTPMSSETQINTQSLTAGVYLMKINIKGEQKTFRVIKK